MRQDSEIIGGLLGRLLHFRADFRQFRKALDAQRRAESQLRRHIDLELAAVRALQASATPPLRGRNLVLGLSVGYGRNDLAPFLESLRDSAYAGDIALLTFDTDAATSAYLASHNVKELAFDSLPLLTMSMNSARMLKYLEFLRTCILGGQAYDYVLLADVRDIVFQGDPFACVDGANIYYFLETGRTVATCPINSVWMTQVFGAEILRDTGSSPVSCAGTVIATHTAMVEYLLWMVRFIAESAPGVRHSGIDQAIHNYLMAKGLIHHAKIVQNGGPVMTVPPDRPSSMVLAPDGRLRNPDGSFSQIVHQYDRDAMLRAAVGARYQGL